MTFYRKNGADVYHAIEEKPVLQDSVASHTAFQGYLARELKRLERGGSPFALALADIDRFSAYNDRQGYVAGDQLLRQTGKLNCSSIRSQDLVARYGRDTLASRGRTRRGQNHVH